MNLHQKRYLNFESTLERIAKNIRRCKNAKLAEFGLRSAHLQCLMQLSNCPDGCTAAKLSVLCGVDKAFISRTISDLLARGYVQYLETANGKRGKRLCLTAQGNAIMPQIYDRLDASVEAVGQGISKREFLIFYQVLREMDHRIDDLAEKENTEDVSNNETKISKG